MTASGHDATDMDLHLLRGSLSRKSLVWFRVFVLGLGATLLLTIGILTKVDPVPALGLVVGFGVLMMLAEHHDLLFGDETSISGSIAVALAAVTAFRMTGSPLLGPVLCGLCAGFYAAHLRRGAWSRVVVNSSSVATSALAAALVLDLFNLSQESSVLKVVLSLVLAILAYWIVNSAVIAIAAGLLHHTPLLKSFVQLVRAETEMLVFALAGALCGLLVVDVSSWFGFAALVGVLVTVDLFVISRPGLTGTTGWSAGLGRVVVWVVALGAAGIAALAAAEVVRPAISVLIGALVGLVTATVGMTLVVRRVLGRWDYHASFGAVAPDLQAMALVPLVGVAVAVLGVLWGMVVAGTIAASVVGIQRWRRRSDDHPPLQDLELLAVVELAFEERRLDQGKRSSEPSRLPQSSS